jgi:hypothetical protein
LIEDKMPLITVVVTELKSKGDDAIILESFNAG